MLDKAFFQDLTNGLMNDTFSAFKEPITLTVSEYDYSTNSTTLISSEDCEGIKLNYDIRETNDSIQVGDYRVLIEQQSITTDVRADNVDMKFNGVDVDIINVNYDPADAVITLQVRDK